MDAFQKSARDRSTWKTVGEHFDAKSAVGKRESFEFHNKHLKPKFKTMAAYSASLHRPGRPRKPPRPSDLLETTPMATKKKARSPAQKAATKRMLAARKGTGPFGSGKGAKAPKKRRGKKGKGGKGTGPFGVGGVKKKAAKKAAKKVVKKVKAAASKQKRAAKRKAADVPGYGPAKRKRIKKARAEAKKLIAAGKRGISQSGADKAVRKAVVGARKEMDAMKKKYEADCKRDIRSAVSAVQSAAVDAGQAAGKPTRKKRRKKAARKKATPKRRKVGTGPMGMGGLKKTRRKTRAKAGTGPFGVGGLRTTKARRAAKPRKAGQKTVTAAQIIKGASGKARKFWMCAGPVRSGCGGGPGSFVVDKVKVG